MTAEDLEALADETGVAEEYREVVSAMEERLFSLDDVTDTATDDSSRAVSVTGLVTYAQCPKRFYWTDVDPLPRRRNPAAVRGSEIHRRIELHQRGEVPFTDLEPGLYDTVDLEEAREGGFEAYETSRFASKRAALVEAPFHIETTNGYRVRGRIDAIYEDDGHWEVVDFKTGRHNDDPARIVQLQAYAVAVGKVDFGLAPPRSLEVTFAYLGGGLDERVTTADAEWVAAARDRLDTLTGDIESGKFDPNPGKWCGNCDFLRFCPEGTAEVGR